MNSTRKNNHTMTPALPAANPVKRWLDWLFKDFSGRRGSYVIAETPTASLILFMVLIVLAVVSYPGFWQTTFSLAAYAALAYWGIKESRTGRSRFRKFLGIGAIIAVAGALLLRLGF